MLGASRAASRCRRITTQEEEAGLHTSGRGPSTDSSHPLARASPAPPEAFDVTLTCTHRPSWRGSVCSYAAAICLRSPAFSEEAVTASWRQLPGLGRAVTVGG